MIVMPAIDLRERACVQLVGGSYDAERVRLPDPVKAAHQWEVWGFRHLHVVDLDAATGRGSNRDVVLEILQSTGMETQVGGGVATSDAVAALLQDGARRVVVGTRAIEDPEWLRSIAAAFPRRIIVAADVLERNVVTRGWTRDSMRHVLDVVGELNDLDLAAIMVTAVHREGRMSGPDLTLVETVASLSAHPVQASGGITTLTELRMLAECGAAAAIVGMALYTRALNPRAVASEFGDVAIPETR